MEEYPEELRTPPVALVSLVGVAELHSTISNFLHSEQPPINTLALPDFSKVSIIAKKEKQEQAPGHMIQPSKPLGILKTNWLGKHRTRVPAIAAALFSREHVYGDPAQWLQVCTNLDTLKTVIRGRNIKLVVVVVQSTQSDDVNEDRLVALRKRAEVDAKSFSIFVKHDTSELSRSLFRLGNIFGELSNAYYREEGRRFKLRIEKRNFNSIDLSVRYNFKVAVYAEFRRDWVEAFKFYESAYTVLQELINNPAELHPIQRLVEIKAVAEQVHFKVSTLLMHGGKGIEAIKWFRQHMALYARLVGSQEAAFLHWEWVSRQYLVFAELLKASSVGASTITDPLSGMPESPVTKWEQQPGYYYQLAAHFMRERRKTFKFTLDKFEASESRAADLFQRSSQELGKPLYVGQYPQFFDDAGNVCVQSLTETEYLGHVIVEEKLFNHSHAVIDLLMKAYEDHKMANASRMVYYVGSEMGREYFSAREYANAKRLFDTVAGLYRQEAWVTLLWETLGYLKECTRKLHLLKEYIEYSLEMAALPISSGPEVDGLTSQDESVPAGPLSYLRRVNIYEDVVGILRGEASLALAQEGDTALSVTEAKPIVLEIDVVSPLRAVLLACVAFHEQVAKPGSTTFFTLSLLTHLPLPIEIDELEIQFNQFSCNFLVQSEKRRAMPNPSKAQGLRIQSVTDLELQPNKWKRLSFNVNAGQSGKLECSSVIARLGPHSTICCRAESPASKEDLPLWKFEDRLETLPMKDINLSFFGQKVIQVEEPEALVDVVLSASGPGFVGEMFPVSVTVNSKGHAIHAGELKINIVDSKAGTIVSPREAASPSVQSYHVELLMDPSNIDKLERGTGAEENSQSCSRLLSLPYVDIGNSWSTQLFIRWHKPKLVTLFVSLGYHSISQSGKEEASQKTHVHRSLQIEGKTAIAINYSYMTPFRRDSLLLTNIQRKKDSVPPISLALNETSVLVVTVKNSSDLPLRLISVTVEEEDGSSCSVRTTNAVYGEFNHIATGNLESCESSTGPDLSRLLMPDETFKQIFSLCPLITSSALCVGTIYMRWKRDTHSIQSFSCDQVKGDSHFQPSFSGLPSVSLTQVKLSPICVEKAPLIISVQCPSHALLGAPFTLSLNIKNETAHLQEIKFSSVDSQSFLLSGAHCDTISILPYASHLLSYKLVPLVSGLQQLPQVILTASRYSASFHPNPASTQLFVFPSNPHLKFDPSNCVEGIVNSGSIHASANSN